MSMIKKYNEIANLKSFDIAVSSKKAKRERSSRSKIVAKTQDFDSQLVEIWRTKLDRVAAGVFEP